MFIHIKKHVDIFSAQSAHLFSAVISSSLLSFETADFTSGQQTLYIAMISCISSFVLTLNKQVMNEDGEKKVGKMIVENTTRVTLIFRVTVTITSYTGIGNPALYD